MSSPATIGVGIEFPQAIPLPEPIRVLLVEDSSDYAQLVCSTLHGSCKQQFDVDRVTRLDSALEALADMHYDAVLLDLCLPDCEGGATVGDVCGCAEKAPVLVLTGSTDPELAWQAGRAGADDCFVKDRADARMLPVRIVQMVERDRARRSAVLGREPGPAGAQLVCSSFASSAYAGLANELIFCDRLTHTLAQMTRHPRNFAVLMIRLDWLDELSHLGNGMMREEMLESATLHIRSRIEPEDSLARIGDSCFALILDDLEVDTEVGQARLELCHALGRVQLDSSAGIQMLGMTASVGVALYPDDGDDLESLLECAEDAQHVAAEQGGDRMLLYRELAGQPGFAR